MVAVDEDGGCVRAVGVSSTRPGMGVCSVQQACEGA